MRSEDNLTSPLHIDSPQCVRGGESPFSIDSPECAKNGDQSCTDERGSEPPGGKDVAVCYGTVTTDSTRGAALQSMYGSFVHRLSHHWDVLQHVDGSVTVKRENGCLSTASSSDG